MTLHEVKAFHADAYERHQAHRKAYLAQPSERNRELCDAAFDDACEAFTLMLKMIEQHA